MSYKHKTECTVIIAYDSSYWCAIEDNYYRLCEISKREKITVSKGNEQTSSVSDQKYIPPANHSWRKDMHKFFNKK